MLILSRKQTEEIIIAGNIRIVVHAIKGGRVIIGIDAPQDVNVRRGELDRTEDDDDRRKRKSA